MGPLSGVRVIDLSQVIAGPYGPALLADSGAEVIKVETLQGEIGRSLAGSFLSLNRGKRSIPLNLQTEGGKEVLHGSRAGGRAGRELVPGSPALKVATLSQLNPRLIYASVTAFGASSFTPCARFRPVAQAMTGTGAQGGRHNPPYSCASPSRTTMRPAQTAAVTMALYDRERTGRGCHITPYCATALSL
jgi:formyl-CoA transferase